MQILKLSVLAASLLLFASLSFAEMTVMSLQERMRQADAVVLGVIEAVQMTGKEERGTEHWMADCRAMTEI